MANSRAALAAALLALSATGCLWRKERIAPKPFSPPPAPPPPAVILPALDEPPLLAIEFSPASLPPLRQEELTLPPFPERVRPRRRVREGLIGTPTTGPELEETESPAPAPPPPVLGALLPDDQKREYGTLIDRLLQGAELRLKSLNSRGSSPQARTNMERLRMFIRQARELRTRDLEAAKAMAERADLLSKVLTGEAR